MGDVSVCSYCIQAHLLFFIESAFTALKAMRRQRDKEVMDCLKL